MRKLCIAVYYPSERRAIFRDILYTKDLGLFVY
uniref:Uncharacterized protein n=1 Tax=Anguilla anguilla TaxID=7936 RepID=A0A0E9Q2M4_ANGAN